MISTKGQRLTKHGRTAVLFFMFLALCVLLPAFPASAGTFQISPTLAHVPPNSASATFRLVNPSDQPLTIQVEAVRWRQQDNESVFAPAEDLIVVPPLVRVMPGRSQVVRIAHRQRDTHHETSYRVRFQEVPPPPPPGFVGVQTSLKIDVPLFFAAAQARDQLQWHAQATATGGLRLMLQNAGTRFARFASIELHRNGKRVEQLQGPLYALAGTKRQWDFSTLRAAKGDKYELVIDQGAKRQELPLTVE